MYNYWKTKWNVRHFFCTDSLIGTTVCLRIYECKHDGGAFFSPLVNRNWIIYSANKHFPAKWIYIKILFSVCLLNLVVIASTSAALVDGGCARSKSKGKRKGCSPTFIYSAMFSAFFLYSFDVLLWFSNVNSAYFDGCEASLCVLLGVDGIVCVCCVCMVLCQCFAGVLLISDCSNYNVPYGSMIAYPLLYRKTGECATFNLPRLLGTHLDWIHFFVFVCLLLLLMFIHLLK